MLDPEIWPAGTLVWLCYKTHQRGVTGVSLDPEGELSFQKNPALIEDTTGINGHQ